MKPVIFGGSGLVTVNVCTLVAVPRVLVTVIFPLVAPLGHSR